MKPKIPLAELKYLLKNSCSRETSDNPDKWTPENPLFGHCAVIAAIVQDFGGGIIRRAKFPEEWKEKLGSRSHYWNEIIIYNADGGEYFDLSRGQFPEEFPYFDFINGKVGQMSEEKDWRTYVLDPKFPNTIARYNALKEKVNVLLKSNPLFTDEKFQHAWKLAFSDFFTGETFCPKMRFACLVYDGKKLITESTNKNFCIEFGKERLCSFDGSSCIRMGMPSRTDATLGDCGHAPMWCLLKVFELGYKPSDLPKLDFYETGFYLDGSPWWRTEPSYTCTYSKTCLLYSDWTKSMEHLMENGGHFIRKIRFTLRQNLQKALKKHSVPAGRRIDAIFYFDRLGKDQKTRRLCGKFIP